MIRLWRLVAGYVGRMGSAGDREGRIGVAGCRL